MNRTLTEAEVEAIVEALDEARVSKVQIRQLTLDRPDMTVADAYAVQDAWIDRRRAAGHHVVGHKIGLTSRAMQQAVGIDEPDYGVLLDDMVFEPESEIPVDLFVEPRLEVELAFVLEHDLAGPDLTIEDVFDATFYATPAIEIIDARVQRSDPETGRPRTVRDTIADNAANAGIVMGGAKFDPRAVDLPWIGAMLSQNGVIEETGLAAGVLGNPARGVIWLADTYAEHGRSLSAGDVVLAGSFTRPVFVRAGDVFEFDYGPLGSFGVRFA